MTTTHTLLFVDDESAILSSLRRLFRKSGYEILTAESGEAALEILAEREVALIVSDQRMPGMIGAEVLAHARKVQPDATRIILTGHADLAAATQAINEGGVHRYIAKPWDDEELRQVIREALERRDLRLENRRLADELRERNRELEELNEGLEARVAQRTQEVRTGLERNVVLNQQLQRTVRELKARDRVAQHLLTVHPLDETLGLLVQAFAEALRLDRVAIFLEDGLGLAPRAAAGQGDLSPACSRALTEARQARAAARWSVVGRAGVAVPVTKGDALLGLIAAEASPDGVDQETEAALRRFAVQTAIALGDARLQDDFGAWRRELDQVMGEIADTDGEEG